MAKSTIGGIAISKVTIDGTYVKEITMDGTVVWRCVTVIDDFEDGDIAEYSTVNHAAQASVVNDSSVAPHGNYYLHLTGFNYIISTTSDGLNYYPQAGDTWRIWFQPNSWGNSPYLRVQWCRQDSSNYYMISLEDTGWQIRSVSGGSTTYVASSSTAITAGNWYELEMQHGAGGAMTATVYNADGSQHSQISGTDSTYTSGNIYLAAGDTTEGYFDYWRVTNP